MKLSIVLLSLLSLMITFEPPTWAMDTADKENKNPLKKRKWIIMTGLNGRTTDQQASSKRQDSDQPPTKKPRVAPSLKDRGTGDEKPSVKTQPWAEALRTGDVKPCLEAIKTGNVMACEEYPIWCAQVGTPFATSETAQAYAQALQFLANTSGQKKVKFIFCQIADPRNGNHPIAQFERGKFHEAGRGGFHRNLEKALKYYTLASQQDHPEAKNIIQDVELIHFRRRFPALPRPANMKSISKNVYIGQLAIIHAADFTKWGNNAYGAQSLLVNFYSKGGGGFPQNMRLAEKWNENLPCDWKVDLSLNGHPTVPQASRNSQLLVQPPTKDEKSKVDWRTGDGKPSVKKQPGVEALRTDDVKPCLEAIRTGNVMACEEYPIWCAQVGTLFATSETAQAYAQALQSLANTSGQKKVKSIFCQIADPRNGNHPIAQFKRGTFHEAGSGGFRHNLRKALKYYTLASQQGHQEAKSIIDHIAFTRHRRLYPKLPRPTNNTSISTNVYIEQLTLIDAADFTKWRNRAHLAQCLLVKLYSHGIEGFPQNERQAKKWNERLPSYMKVNLSSDLSSSHHL